MKKLLTVSLSFFITLYAYSQCNIKVDKPEACLNTPYTFYADFTGINDSIVWDFGNNIKQYCSPVDYVFTSTGNYTITLTLYRSGAVFCSKQVTVPVNPLPVPDFTIQSPLKQCYNDNKFVFRNTSTHPLGTAIVAKTFYFGDSTAETVTLVDSVVKNYILRNHNKYTVGIGVEDAKGCFATKFLDSAVEVFGDLGASYTSPVVKKCNTTEVVLKNNSYAKKQDVASFVWIMGDSSGTNTTDWDSTKYTYAKNGCFSPQLVLEDKQGCRDTFKLSSIACNAVHKPVISLNKPQVVTWDNREIGFTTSLPPSGWTQQSPFFWVFDDPATGPNSQSTLQNPYHKFSNVGIYRVTLKVKEGNCFFDTSILIHIKGPQTTIEKRGSTGNYIPPSQRYQCSIQDTVFFTNNSSYYLNDNEPLNDVGYYFRPFIVYFNSPTQLIIKDTLVPSAPVYDTLNLNGSPISMTLKKGKSAYISANADTLAVDTHRLYFDKQQFIYSKYSINIDRIPEHCETNETIRLWDFNDIYAPQCTTDSRPIYPKLAQYNNQHFSGSLAPKNTYDINGKWVNCNFSHDLLPKHFYTPGKEANYRVKLYITDTSHRDSSIINLTFSKSDPAYPDSAKTQADSVGLALTPPNAAGLKIKGNPCFGNPQLNGMFFTFTNTQPMDDRQTFWIHFDSAADRNDATPGTFDKWIHQTGTVIDRFFTPYQLGTLNQPPNVDSIFWQYQPSGVYPNKIYDQDGWVTVGFRVANGIDPNTGQPCIDEKWYHRAFRYPSYNPPTFDTTVTGTCSTRTVKVNFIKNVQDSLKAVEVYWYGGFVTGNNRYIDSFFRDVPEPFTTNTINYRKRYFLNDTSFSQIDSIVTKRINNLGQVLFADYRDSTIEDKTFTYHTNSIYKNSSYVNTIQHKTQIGSVTTRVTNTTGCELVSAKIMPYGLHMEYFFNSGACVGDSVPFVVSPRYKSDVPDLALGFIDTFNYWRSPTTFYDGTFRPKPKTGYETIRWDFGAGKGWQSGGYESKALYTSPGKYAVKVEITDSLGCKHIIADSIEITHGVKGFAINDTIQCNDTNLFAVTSPFSPADKVSVKWRFGDFKTSTKLADTISFPNPGSYKISLEATNIFNCITKSERFVTVIPKIKPAFTVDSIKRCDPSRIFNFKVLSIDTPGLKYRWEFGDGTFSSQTNPAHTFPQAGSYPVKLRWDYGECADSFYKCVDIIHAPQAAFTITALSAPGSYSFSPLDSSQAGYQWDFGDGNGSANKFPAHTYSAAGSYIVKLTVTGNSGCSAVAFDTVDFALGMEDFYNNAFLGISPNPFKSSLLINSKNLSGKTILEISDVTGKSVLTQLLYFTQPGEQSEVRTEHLSEGLYFVRVYTETGELKGLFRLVKTQ